MSEENNLSDVLRNEAKRICQTLGVDTAIIVATDFDGEKGTTSAHWGGWGNHYARVGSVKEYLNAMEADEGSPLCDDSADKPAEGEDLL